MHLVSSPGSFSWLHTCLRIQAAISWPQSKMTWNSFAFFISFRSGLASLVSVGSCRIFKRMLYRDGALISSCSRMRPADKEDTQREKSHFKDAAIWRVWSAAILKYPRCWGGRRKTTGFGFSPQKTAHMHAFLIHSLLILPLVLGKQTDCYRPIKRINTNPAHCTLFIPKAQNPKNRDLHPPTATPNPIEDSKMEICSCLPRYQTAWNRFNVTLMESCVQCRLTALSLSPSRSLSLAHFRCALMRESSVCPAWTRPPRGGEPDATVTYWATIFTFHFSARTLGEKALREILRWDYNEFLPR